MQLEVPNNLALRVLKFQWCEMMQPRKLVELPICIRCQQPGTIHHQRKWEWKQHIGIRLNPYHLFKQYHLIWGNKSLKVGTSIQPELDLLERDIVDMATRYGGTTFYEYHNQFTARAAAYLKYHNIPIHRSVRNNTLFCNIFANESP